jgi:hypothetical protein
MSVNGEIREAFSGRTLDAPTITHDYSKDIVESSRKKYCTPKVQVEKILSKWDEAGEFSKENLVPELEKPFEEPLI